MTGESDDDRRDPIPLAAEEHIDEACLAFERAWKSGEQPQIEDYLGAVPERERVWLLRELLLLELDYRSRTGQRPVAQDYHGRFPLDTELIDDVFRQSSGCLDELASGTRIRYFGDYELLKEISRGGMGIVYEARQSSLNRVVALKLVLAGQFASEEEVERFRREAEAAANLEHPNIVSIFEVGQHEGQRYYSMAYVDGRSLAEIIRENPLSGVQAACCVGTVARAVEYAHQRGTLHRDLKPANILIDRNDQPQITDFGLAKRVEVDSDLTQSGQILGSPSYMSPEQASGRQGAVGPASDVYALGAILYELLTGRPPFKAETPTETLLQLLNNQPISPRALNPKVLRDLETICLKCLEKDPSRRYATAAALADDLDRFLRGEPIRARPIGMVARGWRWCRRYPAVSSLGMGLLVVLLVGLAGVTSQRDAAERAQRKAEGLRDKATARADELARLNYLMHLATADKALLDNQLAVGRLELDACVEAQRGWEHTFLDQRIRNTIAAEFPGAEQPIYTRDGRLMAIGMPGSQDEDKALVWDLASERRVDELEHTSKLSSLALSVDERWLAGGAFDGELVLWDCQTGKKKWSVREHTARFDGIAFSPDGSLIATVNWDCTLKVVHTSSGTVKFSLSFHSTPTKVMFSPDGRWIVAGFAPVVLVNTSTGTIAAQFPSDGYSVPTFSPDGRWIATAKKDGTITLWDWDGSELREARSWMRGNDSYWDLAFSPDGTRLVTSSTTNQIQVWNVRTGQELASFDADAAAYSLTMSPAGDEVAVFTVVHGISLWRYASRKEGLTVQPFEHESRTLVRISPDGRMIAVGSDDAGGKTLVILDAQTGEQTRTLDGPCRSFAWLPDSLHVVLFREPQHDIEMYNVLTGALVRSYRAEADLGQPFVDSAGRVLTSVGDQGTVRSWDLLSAQRQGEFSTKSTGLWSAVVGRQGRFAAMAFSQEFGVDIWDIRTTSVVRTLPVPGRWPSVLTFTNDGKHLFVGSDGGQLTLHDIESAQQVRQFTGHTCGVKAIALSSNEEQVVSSDCRGRVIIWDVKSTKPLLTLLAESKSYVISLDWSSDNRRIVAGKVDGRVQIWTLPIGS